LKSLVPVSNNFDYFIINNQIKPDEILKGFDDTVAKTTTDAINSLKYDFILSYFANTDATANAFGANSESEMYINALQEISDHIEKIISLVDEETVVILTSDHGIGGDDGENESITDIPLWYNIIKQGFIKNNQILKG
jgi:predicted AlkP superfamily pyrophosphatase or phosphodiesterase